MRATLSAFAVLALAVPARAADPQHVVFLADKLGWADCSPRGGKDVPTPTMTRLAADEMPLVTVL